MQVKNDLVTATSPLWQNPAFPASTAVMQVFPVSPGGNSPTVKPDRAIDNQAPTSFRASSAKGGRKVAFARAAADGDDQLALVLRPLCDLDRSVDIRAGRNADQQAFFLGEAGAPSPAPRHWSRVMTSSTTLRCRFPGTKPAPVPWILCGPRLQRLAFQRLRDDAANPLARPRSP